MRSAVAAKPETFQAGLSLCVHVRSRACYPHSASFSRSLSASLSAVSLRSL